MSMAEPGTEQRGDDAQPLQDPQALRDATRRRAGIWPTIKAVSWSFFGVRASKAHGEDVARLNPIVVIAVGVALAAIFVVTLLIIVRFVTAR